MKIECFYYNSREELAANTYLLIDKNECVVVDPSCDYDGVIEYINNNNLKLKAILITHAHFDHIRGVNRLAKCFNTPIYCHFLDIDALKNPHLNCSEENNVIVNFAPIAIEDGQILNLLKNEPIKVIHTPYHTIGSVCFYFTKSKILISGDSLFKMTIGRDDLPTSDPNSKRSSLSKLSVLPEETKVYPGHGSMTTIKHELLFNRFLKREI